MSSQTTWEFRSIPIDFDVFKALTACLDSPTDSYNDVLRRLLELPPAVRNGSSVSSDHGPAWKVDGVVFPHGTEFRKRFKGKLYEARVDNGSLVFDGHRYDKPSPAAIAITGNSVNGWTFWECRRPGDTDWILIDHLRSR